MNSLEQQYDVVVVGAGPAGSATAIELCRHGLSVGIFDSKSFPRRKVCGGCLNRASISLVNSLLAESVDRQKEFEHSAQPIENYALSLQGKTFRFSTPPAVAVERSRLDNLLLNHAVELGAEFHPKSTIRLEEHLQNTTDVTFRVSGERLGKSRVLVAASGLATHLGTKSFRQLVSADSRVGIETVLDEIPAEYADGLRMAVGKAGYVGLTAIADGRLHVAAAVDRPSLKQLTPAEVTSAILDEAELPNLRKQLIAAHWQGTPPLTSRANRLATGGVFLVGDAAGYVEPFTGEGIRWALHGGIGLGKLIGRTLSESSTGGLANLPSEWHRWYQQNIAKHQQLCRRAAWTLKRPAAVWLTLQLLSIRPSLADYFINKLHDKAEL